MLFLANTRIVYSADLCFFIRAIFNTKSVGLQPGSQEMQRRLTGIPFAGRLEFLWEARVRKCRFTTSTRHLVSLWACKPGSSLVA